MYLWLYTQLLKLYPAEFYAQFADEMTAIFQQRLQEHPSGAFRLAFWESASLLLAIVRERQQGKYHLNSTPFWQKLVVLLLPTLLVMAILLFRSVTFFYVSNKAWLLLAVAGVAIVLLGWLKEGRLTVLALPILGYMLSIVLFHVRLPLIPTEIWIAAPFMLLLAVLLGYAWRDEPLLPVRTWLLPVVALPITGVIFSLAAYMGNGGADQNLSVSEIFRSYILGGLIPTGSLTLVLLIALPLAYRFGAQTVLLLLGFVFFDLFGLSGSLPYDELQRIMAGFFVVSFLLVMPLLMLEMSRRGRLAERLSVLVPVALVYGVFFAVYQVATGGFLTFTLYRSNELMQTLISLYLGLEIYTRLQRKPKHVDSREPVKAQMM